MEPLHWLRQGDAVTQVTALLLLAMSVASWVVMLYKLRLMQRARRDVARAGKRLIGIAHSSKSPPLTAMPCCWRWCHQQK